MQNQKRPNEHADGTVNTDETYEALVKKVKQEPVFGRYPLHFQVLKKAKKARSSILNLPHGEVQTPVWMPVGTKGAIKGLTAQEMEDLGCRILLGNTYHLAYKPTGDLLEQFGGLHNFAGWKYNILTDSGGFQMVSLSKLCEITENGVRFQSPFDSSIMDLRPEDSMKIQNQIGGDIMMQLDDVIKTTTVGDRVAEAEERTVRWLDRCIEGHKNTAKQNLFPIVQGGVDLALRKKNLDSLIARDAAGYAIGGLAGGEEKEDFWKVVNFCTDHLPENKPRYLMGVGYPVDLVVCSCLGVDMFDCVYPTRTARFGTALTRYGNLRVLKAENEKDLRPIQEGCECSTCKNYTRSYLHMVGNKEEVACHLITTHNIHYLLTLMKNLHKSIAEDNLDNFVNEFLRDQFTEEKKIPQWVIDALNAVDIKVTAYTE